VSVLYIQITCNIHKRITFYQLFLWSETIDTFHFFQYLLFLQIFSFLVLWLPFCNCQSNWFHGFPLVPKHSVQWFCLLVLQVWAWPLCRNQTTRRQLSAYWHGYPMSKSSSANQWWSRNWTGLFESHCRQRWRHASHQGLPVRESGLWAVSLVV